MPAFGGAGVPEAGRPEGGPPAPRRRPPLSRTVLPGGAPRRFPFPPQPGPGVRFRPGGGRPLPRDGVRRGVEPRPGGGAGAPASPPDPPRHLASLGRRDLVGSRVPSREGSRAPRRIPGEYPGGTERSGEDHRFRDLPRRGGRTGERGDAGRKIRVPRAREDSRGGGDVFVRPVRRGSDLRGTSSRSKAVRRGRSGRRLREDPWIRRADVPASGGSLRVGGTSCGSPSRRYRENGTTARRSFWSSSRGSPIPRRRLR